MIDPINMTEYDASVNRLEEIALFSVLVAASNAIATANGLDRFLKGLGWGTWTFGPFMTIRLWCGKPNKRSMGMMAAQLKRAGIGKFTKKGRAVVELAFSGLDLKTCTVKDLEKIYNIGRKTSRFFILHTRPDAEVAAVDTHVLHFLRDHGHKVPKSSPGSDKKYDELAALFIGYAKKSGKSFADFDLEVWNHYSGHKRRRDEKVQKLRKVSGQGSSEV
jgi:hypothetical protein